MKYVILVLILAQVAFSAQTVNPSLKEEQTIVANEGIDFHEWEAEFNNSMDKAKVKVQKCEAKSKNCQFEKFQALDPSFDMVH